MRAVASLEQLQVVAFEAHTDTARLLQQSVMMNDMGDVIKVMQVAVTGPREQSEELASKVGGTVQLAAKAKRSNSFSMVDGNVGLPAAADAGSVVEVAAVTMDSVFSTADGAVDLLLVHVGGPELDILRGARRLLTRARGVAHVVFQVYGPESGVVFKRNYDPGGAAGWLASLGYTVRPALGRPQQLRTKESVRRYLSSLGPGSTVHLHAMPRRRR